MTILVAQQLLPASTSLWRVMDVALPLLAVLVGIAGTWLHVAHPLPSEHEQDAALAALLIL